MKHELEKRIVDVQRVSMLVRMLIDEALKKGVNPKDIVIPLLGGAAYVAVTSKPRMNDFIELAKSTFEGMSRRCPP